MPAFEQCIFSLDEMVKIAVMDLKEFHKMFTGRSADAALRFRRELQKGTRDFSVKLKHLDKDMTIRMELVQKCALIEKWCRIKFYKDRLPFYSALPQISAKAKVRGEWENFVAKRGY